MSPLEQILVLKNNLSSQSMHIIYNIHIFLMATIAVLITSANNANIIKYRLRLQPTTIQPIEAQKINFLIHRAQHFSLSTPKSEKSKEQNQNSLINGQFHCNSSCRFLN